MNRKKVELRVLSISNCQAQAGAYALVLGEVNGERTLPIIIGVTEAQAIIIEIRGIIPPRPLTHTLFSTVLNALNVTLLRTLIYKAEKGIFSSYLYLKSGETIFRIDARTSDAVILSLKLGVPILIYEDILEEECLHIGKEDVEDYTEQEETTKERLSSLQAAMQKAISEENYEEAAILRDRIKQMKHL